MTKWTCVLSLLCEGQGPLELTFRVTGERAYGTRRRKERDLPPLPDGL